MKTTRTFLFALLGFAATAAISERDARAEFYTTRSDTFCYDTLHPQTIIQNEVAQVDWAATGDLILTNWGGPSQKIWGIGSSVPLTGSNTATLCYDPDGNLRIRDHAGNIVWKGGSGTTSDNNRLTLNRCSFKLRHDAGTKWSTSTDICSYPYRDNNGGQGWCQARPTTANAQIVWDEASAVELDWQTDGNLVLNATDGRGAQWSSNTAGSGANLCFQADGNLVVYDANGSAVFSAQTGSKGVNTLAIDECGVSLSNGTSEFWRQGSTMCPGLPPATQSLSITARANQRYVCAENGGGNPLIADRDAVGDWESFQLVDLGSGNVALKSLINSRYVTADNAGDSPLIANRTSVGPWETFQWINLPNGDFALRAAANGRYVSATNGGATALVASADAMGPWETFHWQPTPVPSKVLEHPISLFARADSRYVSADNGGTNPLIANRGSVGAWEAFKVVDLGAGQVALASLSNDRYVSADNGGASPLIANRDAVGAWETFQWIDLGNGDFALRSAANGLYVSAENGGAAALIADRSAIGTWETFHWQPASDYALAQRYAPRLRFDGAAPNYPMSAQKYYTDVVAPNSSSGEDNHDYTPVANGEVPTYFQITKCGAQTRIKYWWFYGYQNDCDGVSGEHAGDWESVMVTLSEDANRVAAVTYWAHGYHYTRLAASGGVTFEASSHPVIYPGKTTHASYYTQGGSGSCLFWEDFHNNGSGYHMDSWNNLVSLDIDEEPWMIADRSGGFAWGPDGVHTHPTSDPPTCSFAAAKWAAGHEAQWHTQCEVGDTDSGSGCIEQCKPGYDDTGLLCSKCSGTVYEPWTWSCDTYAKKLYDYDYPIPTTDLGLLVGDSN
jgi:hypothetical protein